jgi:hypothetical protein
MGPCKIPSVPQENSRELQGIAGPVESRASTGEEGAHLIVELLVEQGAVERFVAQRRAGHRATYEGTVDTWLAESPNLAMLEIVEGHRFAIDRGPRR